MRCHSLIQLASWAVMTMCSPHTLHPSLLLSVMLRREGSAGPVYPITAPFSKQPRVAQNVAKILNDCLIYIKPFVTISHHLFLFAVWRGLWRIIVVHWNIQEVCVLTVLICHLDCY